MKGDIVVVGHLLEDPKMSQCGSFCMLTLYHDSISKCGSFRENYYVQAFGELGKKCMEMLHKDNMCCIEGDQKDVEGHQLFANRIICSGKIIQ